MLADLLIFLMVFAAIWVFVWGFMALVERCYGRYSSQEYRDYVMGSCAHYPYRPYDQDKEV